jgi:pyruvate dehydrogenase E2 component (dihydrolipoamide acetyltransferase)
MAVEVVMPKLSDTMEEGRIIKWLKQVGDPVKEGEPLIEVETDKADIEVEAFDSGILIEITVDEGETVKVGEKIGVIGSEEEAKKAGQPVAEKEEAAEEEAAAEEPEKEEAETEEERVEAREKPEEKEREEAEKKAEIERKRKAQEPARRAEAEKREEEPRIREPQVRVHMEQREAIEKFVARRAPEKSRASPLAKELAQQHDVDFSKLKGTGPQGEIVRRDVERFLAEEGKQPAEVAEQKARKPWATPLAVTLAEKEGIDLEEVKGTGIDGRIREIDVKRYAARRCALRGEEYKELSLMRKTIARRMTESKRTVPHFYLTMPIDMGAAMELRKKLNEGRKDEEKISVNDIIVKAAALALAQEPEVNATFSDEKIKVNERINVGIATATPDGLVVPVIFDTNKKSVPDISAETKDKAERARKRKLKPDEYSNGTFTVSNLGMFGIEQFSAIIDPGQSAILAVGAVVKEPVVEDGDIQVRQTMRATLSCDHRVVDGYTGTQYLVKLKAILENPDEAI